MGENLIAINGGVWSTGGIEYDWQKWLVFLEKPIHQLVTCHEKLLARVVNSIALHNWKTSLLVVKMVEAGLLIIQCLCFVSLLFGSNFQIHGFSWCGIKFWNHAFESIQAGQCLSIVGSFIMSLCPSYCDQNDGARVYILPRYETQIWNLKPCLRKGRRHESVNEWRNFTIKHLRFLRAHCKIRWKK